MDNADSTSTRVPPHISLLGWQHIHEHLDIYLSGEDVEFAIQCVINPVIERLVKKARKMTARDFTHSLQLARVYWSTFALRFHQLPASLHGTPTPWSPPPDTTNDDPAWSQLWSVHRDSLIAMHAELSRLTTEAKPELSCGHCNKSWTRPADLTNHLDNSIGERTVHLCSKSGCKFQCKKKKRADRHSQKKGHIVLECCIPAVRFQACPHCSRLLTLNEFVSHLSSGHGLQPHEGGDLAHGKRIAGLVEQDNIRPYLCSEAMMTISTTPWPEQTTMAVRVVLEYAVPSPDTSEYTAVMYLLQFEVDRTTDAATRTSLLAQMYEIQAVLQQRSFAAFADYVWEQARRLRDALDSTRPSTASKRRISPNPVAFQRAMAGPSRATCREGDVGGQAVMEPRTPISEYGSLNGEVCNILTVSTPTEAL